MELYSAHFTTRHVVTQFDNKGNKVGEYEDDIPQVIHALPLSTANAYSKFKNFRVERYIPDVSKRPMAPPSTGFRASASKGKRSKAKPAPQKRPSAAETGNLSDAINEVA